MIYPPAVLRLAGKYRLRNIGGTSAGAVAAALTAAAELNRDSGGFVRLETTAKALQQPSFLRNLFQGNRQTEPLLKILMKAPEYGSELEDMALKVKGKSLSRLLLPLARWLSGIVADSGVGLRKGRWSGLFAGVAAALILSAAIWTVAALFGVVTNFLFWFPLLVLGLIFGAIGFKLGGLLTGIGKLYETATSKMPDNLFGICSGLRDPSNTYNQVAATEWLHDSIEKIAANPDRSGLLTFNQLEARYHPIKLQFVTTDISAGRPYVLPFDDLFIFKKEHFDKIFTADVVRHLVTKSRKVPGIKLPGDGEYYFLPGSGDWPVVVGARLSMSFPFLFSSVPLFSLPLTLSQVIKASVGNAGYVLPNPAAQFSSLRNQGLNTTLQNDDLLLNAEDLVPHWFSDGGIASNFPIHFFDSWLPARPTFGITLRYLQGKPLEQGASPQQTAARRAYMHSLDQPRA
ncbi:MAG: patatin-like phospholipase family protein, partial [Burkholderiales bacterium]|nr:patatin-like phospholipase family protein [Burkholderiales bacterium]